MPKVFINYRTGDGEQAAIAIERELSHRFGEDSVFRASKSLKVGQDFRQSLLQNVRRSDALLAIVGPGWLDARDKDDPENQALDNKNDWVRKELLEAFSCGIPVVPVLVGRLTERLDGARLPKPLARLAWTQSMRLDTQQGSADLIRICDGLTELVPDLCEQSVTPGTGPQLNNGAPGDGGPRIQGGDMHGGVAGTVIGRTEGPVNTGPGNQNHHQQHIYGDGATFFSGGNDGQINHRYGKDGSRRSEEQRHDGDGK